MDDLDRLCNLIRARHPGIHMVTSEELDALDLIREASRVQDVYLWQWDAMDGLTSPLDRQSGVIENTLHPSAACSWLLDNDRGTIITLLDITAHLHEPGATRALRRLLVHASVAESTVIVVDHESKLPAGIEAWMTPFEIGLPTDGELDAIVRRAIKAADVRIGVDAKINSEDYDLILKNLRGLTKRQARQIIRDVVTDDQRFCAEDLNHVLASKRQIFARSGVLEFVESPATLDQVGGMGNLKRWLTQRESGFSEKAQEFGIVPPRGVLLLGVQGAGKSLCSKAIATAWQRPLLRLDPGVLYDRFVGESERRLRDALGQAEAMAPVVLWIDEIEKGFASAAEQSNDGGLSRRMFGTLLTWMQEHEAPVFLVATANDVQALPPELLRKGRFDEIFFIDLPGPGAREQIFKTHLERRGQKLEAFDLGGLVSATDGYSGAEIEQAVVSALHQAFATKENLSQGMVEKALRESPPLSVTMRERIDELRRWADGRCVPAE